MSKHGLSNLYILNFLGKLKLKHWKGVFSSDNIPKFKKDENYAIIVNLSRSNEHGSHFIVLAQRRGQVFVFDSLALPYSLLPQSIQKIMTHFNTISILTKPIQSTHSLYCGFYCIYFILYLSLKELKLRLQFSPKLFSLTNLMSNDNLCLNLIVNMIKAKKIKI